MIELKNVVKTYFLGEEQVEAIKEVNVSIKDGEYVSILGPSGCGKSTLMHLMGLLEVPSQGEIEVDNKKISKLTDDELSEVRNRKVGFVFQAFNLINKFTVWENVLMPTKYAKGELDFDPEARAEELLKRVQIWHRKDFFPNKISGGQQQRVAIARALIMKPALILADEPTGNLDTKTGEEIIGLVEGLNKDLGVTVVIVTHESEIAKRAGRTITMKDGEIIKS